MSKWTENLGKQVARGTAWVVALRIFVRLLGVISTIILARILVPEDFGLIALATVIASGLELFGAFNFDTWLVCQKDPSPDQYNTVWTLSVIRSIAMALLIAALAIPVSQFFDDPRLANILLILSFCTAFAAFQNVGIIEFQKYLQFEKEFQLLATVKVGSFLVTVGLAFLIKSYWALLWGIATGRILHLILSYWLHSYRPSFSLSHARELFEFSKWLLSASIFGFLYTQSHVFIIGKILGNQALGLYSVAQEISNLAATELLMPLRRVLFPAYSKMQNDVGELREAFLQTFSLILLLGLPIAAGLGLVAEPLVWVVLGNKWLEAIPLLQVLAFYGASSICIANQGPLLIALGYTKFLSNLYGIGLLLQLPIAIWAALKWGALGVAYAVASIHFLLFIISLVVTLRCLNLRLFKVIGDTWKIWFALVAMALFVLLIQQSLSQQVGPILMLLFSVAAGVLGYCCSILLLWWLSDNRDGPDHMVVMFILSKLSRAKS